MKIRAAVLNAPNQPFAIEELDLDPPRAGEVLVKIAACGVCHSDWHVATGDTPQPMPVASTNTAAGLCSSTCSSTRLATCIRSEMRNFTAGIERAWDASSTRGRCRRSHPSAST